LAVDINLKLFGGFQMEIKVLGSGCSKCIRLYDNARAAVQELGVQATVEKVTDMATIASYGVMSTPALVIDGQVAVMGRVPSTEQVKMLLKARGKD
jgi:small redox-active disulfide protein 2